MTRAEMAALGWDACDVIIVTGDAFVDHPSFGSAVIARVLLAAGYRTGIIAQPGWNSPHDITRLGRPRIFFGVTAGNVDSLVANHSPNLQKRRTDDYSPGGRPGLRPNRATIVYANLVRQTFPDVPLIIGGIEASLRRLAHYDYWEDSVRRSLLLDTRADILLYGMAERAVVEVASRLAATSGKPQGLTGIRGTCVNLTEPPPDAVALPSFEQARDDKEKFNEAFRLWHREADNPHGKAVAQPHGDRWVVQYPPPRPMTAVELDQVYDLPFTRLTHPSYKEPTPALETVKFSITSHRGCLGSCAFCSLSAHQGRIIQWRSKASILREAVLLTRSPGFRGHITNVGGPTANMYGATCPTMNGGSVCTDRECLYPRLCHNLKLDFPREIDLLRSVSRVPGVKKVTIGTGVRYDLLDGPAGQDYLEQLCRHHISGQLRVAPEHVSPRVLASMHKATPAAYARFRHYYADTNRRLGKKQYLIPYFISGHPGATLDDAVELAEHLVKVERMFIRQVQQFTPLPMTVSGAAYHTAHDPLTGRSIPVARTPEEVRLQRCLLQLREPKNFAYAVRQLDKAGRSDLARRIRALKPLLRHSS
jgi:uncharacterized radical SAM protein YgiQ